MTGTKMRSLAWLFLLLTAICCPSSRSGTTNITTNVTTKIEEKRGQNGAIESRIETSWRGGEKIMSVVYQKVKGKWQVKSRAYLVGGDLVMIESDEDGNDSLETLTFINPNNREIEVFERQSDGSVKPVSSEKLAIIKQMQDIQDNASDQMAKLIAKGNVKPEEVEKLIESTKAKMQELEKELRELDGTTRANHSSGDANRN